MKWRMGDIIDLEYLLHQDAAAAAPGDREHIRGRDRAIFLESGAPATGTDMPDRTTLIRTWLNRRREKAKSDRVILPGEHFEGLYRSLRTVFLVAGLVLGGAAGASFLTYTGARPVNVFVYLAVFVLSQLLLLLLLLALSLYRLARKSLPVASPLSMLISRGILRILLSARYQLQRQLPAKQRLQAGAVLGTVIGKARAYGFLFLLPPFLLAQLFAVGLNLGLLGATLFKVVTADIAFGWQSTVQLSPSAVHLLAQKMAWPWSWAMEGDMAFPTLAQIEGSRIILKEGIYHLATPDLVSWWPFLCFAVLVYGLLPRLLLLLGAAISLRRYLNALDFRQGIYEQLLLRMTTPLVTTRGQSVADQAAATESVPHHPGQARKGTPAATVVRKLLVLIPDEIGDACSLEEIEAAVNRSGRYGIEEIIRTGRDYATDKKMLASLREREGVTETDILLVQEAWQPPIMEYIDFISQLRQAIGEAPCIRIGLIGKPGPNTIFTPVAEESLRIWSRKITALGDPCITCEGLVANAR